MMNKAKRSLFNYEKTTTSKQSYDEIYNYEDAVIMAVSGTDNYDVSNWWLEAIRIVSQTKHPELKQQFQDVTNYLSEAIHAYHPDIFQEKWDSRSMKDDW